MIDVKQNKFAFFANFAETIKTLPVEKQPLAYQAICEYGIYGILPEDESLKIMCLMSKASIFKEDGRKNNGGNHNPQGKNQYDNTVNSGQSRSNLVNSGQSLSKQETENIKEKEINKEKEIKIHNALEIFGNAFKGTDAIVGIFDRPDGTTREGIQIKNPHLMAFVKSRFDKSTLEKVSDWAIDHNQRGHTYNASALLKLLCKFQSNIEPSINFNSVQAEYISFEPKKKGGTK